MPTKIDMAKFAKFCKDMGFIYQSSEIYGGINGFWDYGPLGVELKRNIKEAWWQDMVRNPPPGPGRAGNPHGRARLLDHHEPEGLGGQRPRRRVQRPDGGLQDVQKRFVRTRCFVVSTAADDRAVADFADRRGGDARRREARRRPRGRTGAETVHRAVKHRRAAPRHAAVDSRPAMCETSPSLGVQPDVRDPRGQSGEENKAYLRPETAQGIFANYRNVLDSTRLKLPFGIAQVGKAFRNEINPRNFTFRCREFEQMEIEFFCHPSESHEVVRVLARPAQEAGTARSASRATTSSRASRARRNWPTTRSAPPTSSTCSRSPTSRRNWKASPTAATST